MSQEFPSSQPSAIAPEPVKNSFSRIIGALFSPRETFEDVNRKPDWLIPLIVITLVALATTYVFLTHANMADLIAQQIEKSGRPVPGPDQLASAAKIGTITSYVGIILGVPIGSLIEVGLLFVIFNFLLGAETTFKKMFSATMYAAMPGVIKSLLAIPILFVKQPAQLGNPADIVQSNLSLFIDPDNKALFALGKSLDVFTLWSVLLLAFAFTCVSKNLTYKKSVITMIILWAIVVAGMVSWAAFRG